MSVLNYNSKWLQGYQKSRNVKDPVLPKILHGLTVTFILYESRFGLAIVKLYCLFNLQMNVVMPSLLN